MARDWMSNDDDPEASPALVIPPPLLPPEPSPALPTRLPVGRPKGSTTSNRKQVALRIPKRVIDYYKADGPGWQTRMIDVLEREATGD